VVPVEVDPEEAAEQLWLSGPIALVYLAITLPLGVLRGRTYGDAVDRWLVAGVTSHKRETGERLPTAIAPAARRHVRVA
jgi:hypothetical protein